MSDTIDVLPEEAAYITESGRCDRCGHLEALHNYHCCFFCNVPDCDCTGI